MQHCSVKQPLVPGWLLVHRWASGTSSEVELIQIFQRNTPQAISELSVCPLCFWPVPPMWSSTHRSNGLTCPSTFLPARLFPYRHLFSMSRAFGVRLFFKGHFYLCQRNQTDQTFCKILSFHLGHLTQVLLPLADCR